MTTELDWFKSSYSSNDGPDCVEVAIFTAQPTIFLRDSKNKDGARLAFTGGAWSEFVEFAAGR
ncbi:DUF397 domain-containing protein [Streptomyces collinus]|uniref:DUF397 domain-containing protein n=1 Tax=Streptomyces collinus TaxID=42684 RepID=UPI00367E9B78